MRESPVPALDSAKKQHSDRNRRGRQEKKDRGSSFVEDIDDEEEEKEGQELEEFGGSIPIPIPSSIHPSVRPN